MNGADEPLRWAGNLVLAQANPNTASEIDYVTVQADGLYIFPLTQGLYPLRRYAQCELYWGLWAMPTDATFVDLQLFGFRAELDDPTQVSPVPTELGFIAQGMERFEIYGAQMLELDFAANLIHPHPAVIRKTAADATFTPSFPFNTNLYTLATRFSFPIREDRFGFRITTDGTNETGSMTLWANLG